MLDILTRFFESNVVIPKGTTRHPYADVYHEAIENTDLIVESIFTTAEWSFKYTGAVRIKPSEPVYEWQWYYINNGVAYISESFLTIGEAVNNWDGKFEETKREQK